jgi:stage V sporulation protein G
MSNISKVEVFPIKNHPGKVKANGSFVYGGALKVKFTLINGEKGLFVGLPTRKGKDKEGKDTWYPEVSFLDKNLQQELQKAAVDAFNKYDGKGMSQGSAAGPTSQDNVPF